jgi:hypothetical protein
VRALIERGGPRVAKARPNATKRDPEAAKRVQSFFGDASSREG